MEAVPTDALIDEITFKMQNLMQQNNGTTNSKRSIFTLLYRGGKVLFFHGRNTPIESDYLSKVVHGGVHCLTAQKRRVVQLGGTAGYAKWYMRGYTYTNSITNLKILMYRNVTKGKKLRY